MGEAWAKPVRPPCLEPRRCSTCRLRSAYVPSTFRARPVRPTSAPATAQASAPINTIYEFVFLLRWQGFRGGGALPTAGKVHPAHHRRNKGATNTTLLCQ